MPINQRQAGNSCQFFSILHLMDLANRGNLNETDCKNAINTMITRGVPGIKPLANYCIPAKINRTPITQFTQLVLNTWYYVDNKKHAVLMQKTDVNRLTVWNPTLAADATFDIAADTVSIASNGQTYETGKLSVWLLKPDLQPNDNQAVRQVQITIFNELAIYLRTYRGENTTNQTRIANIPNAITTSAETYKKAFVTAASTTFKFSSQELREAKAAVGIN